MLKIFKFDTVSSTMDVAKEILNKSEAPFLVIADYQTSGRGRNASRWESLPDAFLGTFAFKKTFEPKPKLSLIFALELIRLLDLSATNTSIKWPNDLIEKDTGKKFGGILIESVDNHFLIGLGLNLYGNRDFGGLKNLRKDLDKQRVITILAEGLSDFLNTVQNFWDLPLRFEPFDYLKNKPITFNRAEGESFACGITEEGGLIIRNKNTEPQIIFSAAQIRTLNGY